MVRPESGQLRCSSIEVGTRTSAACAADHQTELDALLHILLSPNLQLRQAQTVSGKHDGRDWGIDSDVGTERLKNCAYRIHGRRHGLERDVLSVVDLNQEVRRAVFSAEKEWYRRDQTKVKNLKTRIATMRFEYDEDEDEDEGEGESEGGERRPIRNWNRDFPKN